MGGVMNDSGGIQIQFETQDMQYEDNSSVNDSGIHSIMQRHSSPVEWNAQRNNSLSSSVPTTSKGTRKPDFDKDVKETGNRNDSGVGRLSRYDEEMQYEENSTVDDSSGLQHTLLLPSSTADWNTQHSSYAESYASPSSVPRLQSKGKKKMKSEEEEDIDIDNFVQQDMQRIPVKMLRKVIPKLRIAVYYSELLTSGKRKTKHLWDERPADWPTNIPFKDPNNACKDAKKPGKDELGPMFNYLKNKYLQNHPNLQQSATTSDARESSYSFMSQQHPVMTESTTSDRSAFFYSSVSDNPILPQIHFMQQQPQSSDSGTVGTVFVGKTDTAPYMDLSELMVKQEKGSSSPFAATSQANVPVVTHHSLANSKPQPVTELYARLEKKYKDVLQLSADDRNVLQVLREVEDAVIRKLYNDITPSDTRICLMFLDAGHQMEALLDVMLVLEQVDLSLLQSGSQEIIKKFNTQSVHYALLSTKSVFATPHSFRASPAFRSELDEDSTDAKLEDNLIADLGLDLYDLKSVKGDQVQGHRQVNDSSVPLFKPRRGVNGTLEMDKMDVMGIQSRSPQLSSDSEDSKSAAIVPVIEMVILEEDSSPPPLQTPQEDRVLEIRRILESEEISPMMMDVSSDPLFSGGTNFSSDDLEDIDEIIRQEYGAYGSEIFCQETGGGGREGFGIIGGGSSSCSSGLYDEHSQLVPSGGGAKTMIPSMLENLTCTDSENEDGENPIPAKPTRYGRGGGVGKESDYFYSPFR